MIPELRQEFNARFTPEKYARFLDRLTERCGTPVPFRNSETPCFFPQSLLDRMERYGRELVAQLMGDPAYLAAASATVPEAYRVPNENPRPLFIQADFGLDENRDPKLVEIQAFPSLYAYQPTLSETYSEVYSLAPDLKPLLGDWTMETYRDAVKRAILGSHAPKNVVLLEIQPFKQKTLPDFLLTQQLCGIPLVCISEVIKDGRRLFYEKDGRRVPIERIYNRVIVDELVRTPITPGFDLRDDLDVEWAGHPNWYFKISKFSVPYFRHESVSETHFLDRLETIPDDLENWVLKPLFSFAGLGVKVGPTRADIEAVTDRSQYILQRRVNFTPVIETPYGPTKVEIRIMYLWPDEAPEPQGVCALLRMGRGAQMGVDFNRDMAWVGASAAFSRSDPR